MLLLRMIAVIFRLSGCDVLTPWRSPLLRWRLETYGVRGAGGRLLHADQITPLDFLRFLLTHRRALARFLRWAASL